jgi:hypothetical protein
LFETTGQVELAEILFDGTRSKGCGVVQFGQIVEAETAIAKFQSYVYGGRPLGELRCWGSGMISLMRLLVRRAVQRPLAHVHADCGQGRAGSADAGGCGLVTVYIIFHAILYMVLARSRLVGYY